MTTETRESVRARLSALLKTVPPSLSTAGVEKVRRFKKFHADATKAMSNTRTAVEGLLSIENQSRNFYP